MKILFITPYPPSRIRVRAYGFVQQLCREHEVTILTQSSNAQEWRDCLALQQQGFEVIVVSEPRSYALARSGLALASSTPLQVAYARSGCFLHQAQLLCARKHFDIIHVEHLRGIASMDALVQDHPLVWDAVDCISELWRQTARSGPSLALRTVALLEYKRTKRYERQLQQKIAHIVTTSESDRQSLFALARSARLKEEPNPERITVVPCGVDLDYFAPSDQRYRPYNIVFSGKMSYHANVAAAQYLYHKIMPLIWRVEPAATLTIVGSHPPQSIQRLRLDQRVEITGYVDDIRPYIKRAHIMLSPMVYSVGIQNKVLETMALGTPAVISAHSAQALSARPGHDMFSATSAQEFATAALHLMRDAALREKISQQARQYVEQRHRWSDVTQQLVHIYQRAISGEAQKEMITVPDPVASDQL
ncbi:glycosyltransferase [Dictyobacter kobayashii]|uniref:Glycosyl transferase family 1 n=1 Tax=Dictyobacter kobayashii TaxID=2014872 RepID=A0A402AWI0_9CHLR|nr:glycosyltransferase [Dictyobacter kobayashii]GCE23427.1 glycosyl transferase family 1 [Dictyobacter kobayashii]